MPILFRFSIASVRVALENPAAPTSSKHPVTVSVSNPNVFFNKNSNDSECIDISAIRSHCGKESAKRSSFMSMPRSQMLMTTGLNAAIGDK